jgi:hypothetical protein
MPTLDLPTLLLAVAVALCVALVGSVAARWRATRRGRAANRSGQRAEAAAERLLVQAGFRIEQRQVTGHWALFVDGEPVQVRCRADLLVRRRRRRYVAEVKSGAVGSRATSPATRRQLLEYRTVFAVHGVLLVDMARGRIHEVCFPDRGS